MARYDTISKWVQYVPEFDGNRSRKEDEMISCEIKLYNQKDFDDLTEAILGSQRDGFRPSKGSGYSNAALAKLNEHVRDIRNLTVVDEDDKEQEVKTMKDLHQVAGLRDLYTEISNAADSINTLKEGEIKNFV